MESLIKWWGTGTMNGGAGNGNGPLRPPVVPAQVGYPYRYNWAPYPAQDFVYTYPMPMPCGPIYDPYCPNRVGVSGLPDIYGYPTCCCAASGKCHTPAIVPVGDEPVAIVTYPLGPYVLSPHFLAPPRW
jgi:hypothetical protein